MNKTLSHTAESYSEILQKLYQTRKVKTFKAGMLAGHACRLLSPYCSALFIKLGYSPNKVTIFMIIFGIIGSVFFALPYGWAKIVGYVFWYLWFTMDLSDGEVARYTKKFSKYGTEMDYMAHLIDHPLMNIAIWITFIGLDVINPIIISLIFIIGISFELITRSLITIRHFHLISSPSIINTTGISLCKYLLVQSTLYPNFIICFTPFIIIDYFCQEAWIIYIYLVWFLLMAAMSIYEIVKILIKFLRN